jgi:hypothetical protein
MSSSYSPDLRIELIGNGEQSGVWGTTTNNNLGTLIEDAISGVANVSVTSANQALTAYNGAADQARCSAINVTTTTGAPFNIYVPPVTKLYVVINSSAYAATIYASTALGNTTAAGAGVSLAANSTSYVRCDGTNMLDVINHISGTLFVENNLTLGAGASVANNLAVTGSAALGVSQTATITTANPAVITVTNAPQNNATVSFTTSGTLPANIIAGVLYYVTNRTSNTFNVALTPGGSSISTASGSQSGTHTVSTVPTAATAASGSNSTQLATTAFVSSAIGSAGVTYQTLVAARAATTANITLSGTQTIDGYTVSVGDRVLVKDQTSAQDNGVYVVAAGSWTRATDANTATEVAAAQVPVLQGTSNGGKTFITTFKSTDTLGSTAMPWDFLITGTNPAITAPTITNGSMSNVNIFTPNITNATMLDMSSSVITSGTAQTPSGTGIIFSSIPSWVKRITVQFRSVTTATTNSYCLVQLGVGGTIQTTGYNSVSYYYNSGTAANTTLGLLVDQYASTAKVLTGQMVITNIGGTNIWVASCISIGVANGSVGTSSGGVTLSGTLDTLKFTNLASTTTFTGGTVNILYE